MKLALKPSGPLLKKYCFNIISETEGKKIWGEELKARTQNY